MIKKPTPALLATIAITAALTLAACGGGSDGSGSVSTTATGASHRSQSMGSGRGEEKSAGAHRDASNGRPKGEEDPNGPTGAGEGRRQVPVSPVEVSGGGSAQFHVEGGDNSVQDYGDEAGESELRQAAETTHSLFVAEVRAEWARACSLLAADEQKSLEQAAAQSPQGGGKGCAAALAAVMRPAAGSLAREITLVDAAGLRQDGEQGFLLYVGAPTGTVYAMPMQLESGIWKPTAISGSALPGVPSG